MRNLFVKGFMAAAAVVALASCSNDEEVVMTPAQGETSVSLGVSVAVPGTKAATSQDDANQGDSFSKITNINVVPVDGNSLSSAIELGDIESGAASITRYRKDVQINSSVAAFRVYANVPKDVMENITSGNFSYPAPEAGTDNAHGSALIDWMEGNGKYDGAPNMDGKSLVGQYPLMYFANTATSGGYYKTTSEDEWDEVNWIGVNKTTNPIKDDNRVKIDNVQYAVGVLASGVSYRRETQGTKNEEEAACFDDEETKQTYTQLGNTGMVLKAIYIQDQPTAIDRDLRGTDHNGVLVAPATNATLQTSLLNFAETTNRVAGANIYAIVMPETNNEVLVSFQFQNTTGQTLNLKDGQTVANNDFVYYSTTLTSNNNTQGLNVFDADYTTLLNANIINWSNGSKFLPVPTNLQIGVEIDVQWQKGLYYEVDI